MYHGTVELEHSAPITIKIDDVSYALRQSLSDRSLYFIKLNGGYPRSYHNGIIKKIEIYLNRMKKRIETRKK